MKYTDTELIDFLIKEQASVGFYANINKFVVCTSISESSNKNLRKAIIESIEDHNEND